MEGIIYQYDNIKTINLNEYDLIVKSINSDYDSFANLMKLHKGIYIKWHISIHVTKIWH